MESGGGGGNRGVIVSFDKLVSLFSFPFEGARGVDFERNGVKRGFKGLDTKFRDFRWNWKNEFFILFGIFHKRGNNLNHILTFN